LFFAIVGAVAPDAPAPLARIAANIANARSSVFALLLIVRSSWSRLAPGAAWRWADDRRHLAAECLAMGWGHGPASLRSQSPGSASSAPPQRSHVFPSRPSHPCGWSMHACSDLKT